MDSFDIRGCKKALQIFLITKKMNRWVLGQIKSKTSEETKTKLKVSYFRNIIRRQSPLVKTVILRKIEGSRKRKRPNKKWIDSMKEVTR